MSRLTAENEARLEPRPSEEWHGRHLLREREESGGSSLSLLIGGLAVIGLGALAWYYLGPDLRRYMKIRSM